METLALVLFSSDSLRDRGKELSESGVVGLDSLTFSDDEGGGGRWGMTEAESGGELTADLLRRRGQEGDKPRERWDC